VTVAVERGKRTLKKEVVAVTRGGGDSGHFKLKGPTMVKPGRYVATASLDGNTVLKATSARSRVFKVKYPSLNRGDGGKDVKLFNRLLDKQGYVPSNGKRFTERTGRAVLAYRKVHGMARITRATSQIFKTVADGRGTYKVKHPGAGKHAEVNIGRQVLVLAEGGKARRIYHVSSGASGTPSDRGHYRFYRRQPGYNSIRMFYSVYYNRGEAIHGYSSVPTKPASHGCIRTPISDARSIYNWVSLGMSIYVY
jgi:lipoprotein-anchoring transpeptidase ErfK/SrfK